MQPDISDPISKSVSFTSQSSRPLPEGMTPFDLTAALAGKPVVTGEGKEVTQLTIFKNAGKFPLAGVLEDRGYNTLIQRTIEGRADAYENRTWDSRDLFMKVETKDVYFNIYGSGNNLEAYGHPTEEEADKAQKLGGRKRVSVGDKALKVTVEV